MASGCTNSGGSSAVLFQKLTPDTLVKYTGIPYPQFGICTGDLLSEVEASILQQILNFSEGKGITITDIDLTQCECFQEKVGCCGAESCQTLICILEAYLECLCDLYADVTQLKEDVDSLLNGPYDVKCLTTVTNSSTLPAIVNQLITQHCEAEADIANLQNLLNTLSTNLPATIGNFLNSALLSCQTGSLIKAGTGASFTANLRGFCPVGTIQMYAGPIVGVFDTSGMGFSPGPACGWALCNGEVQNGTQTVDMRGYKPVGVNNGSMGGGSQNSEVNNSINPGQNYALNAHGGEIKHLLAASEAGSAPHGHPVIDPGHSHKYAFRAGSGGGGQTDYMMFSGVAIENTLDGQPNIGTVSTKIKNNTTGITISNSDAVSASNAHENRDPYRAVYFIQRIF